MLTQIFGPLISLSHITASVTVIPVADSSIDSIYVLSSELHVAHMADCQIVEPFPIFEVAGRFMLYDLSIIAHVREKHRICGVLIGNIPQATQQNIFNGIPVELMSEEARLLVTQGHAYVVDDVASHLSQFMPMTKESRKDYDLILESKGLEAAAAAKAASDQRKSKWRSQTKTAPKQKQKKEDDLVMDDLFGNVIERSPQPRGKDSSKLLPMLVTPLVSYPPLTTDAKKYSGHLQNETPSYPLYEHLHSQGYFISPGLRFGCQYMVYPGDPLRYHSHFLAVGKTWSEPIDLMDIVGGGRLGTGVKKGYLLGGKVTTDPSDDSNQSKVRTFCFEWAAM